MKWLKTWYESRFLVVFASMILFPLGMYGLWKSSRFKKWNDLKTIGKIWRFYWILCTLGGFLILYIPDNLYHVRPVDKQPSDLTKDIPAPVLSATITRFRDEPGGGMYWVNSITMDKNGSINIKLNRPQMREGNMVYSRNDDNFAMIGAEYHDNDKNSYYNNNQGTSEKLTLVRLDYPGKRAEFEFSAQLQSNLRDKGTTINVRFILEGDHFDTAVNAMVIATEES